MHVYRRLLALGGLLLVEYLVLSLLFDVRVLETQSGPLSAFAYLGDVATIGLLAVALSVLLQGPRLRAALLAATQQQTAQRRAWPFLLLHAVAYAALLLISARLLAPDADPATVRIWIGPWLLCGLVLVASLAPIALPLSAARALLSTGASSLGLAAAGGVVVWGFALGSDLLWPALADTTIAACAWLLGWVPNVRVLTPGEAMFGTPTFLVRISAECSGLEGMGLLLAFLGGYMLVHRGSLRFPHALALLPVAVAASFGANLVRIVALVLVGTWVSPEIALGGFHSKAGWFFFCLLAFGFVVALRRSSYFAGDAPLASAHETHETENKAAPYLLPLLGMLACALLTGLISTGFDPFYGVRVPVMILILWIHRRAYREYWVKPAWHAFAIGVAVFAFWIALVPGHGTEGGARLQAGLSELADPARAVWIAMRVLCAVVLVPVVEELAFRGYLLRRLVNRDFTGVAFNAVGFGAILGSSIAFGILHTDFSLLRLDAAGIAGILAGAAFALAAYRRGRLVDAIVAHAVANGLIAADVLITGAWGLW